MYTMKVAAGIGWTLGVLALGALVYLIADDAYDMQWSTGVSVFVSGFTVLLLSEIINRNPRLQLLTWTPLPIAFVAALWILEGVPTEHMVTMMRAAFATSFIGVAFDVALLNLVDRGLPNAGLWAIVALVTSAATVTAYFAAGDVLASFCLGIVAAAMNLQNIPHMRPGDTIVCACVCSRCEDCRLRTSTIVIPFVWILLTISVVLQEFQLYRWAGLLSNAPCLHFVVAVMLWTTTRDLEGAELARSVLTMKDNVGIGSVAVFSSSVFTAVFWRGLNDGAWDVWTLYATAVTISLAVSFILYFVSTKPQTPAVATVTVVLQQEPPAAPKEPPAAPEAAVRF